MRSFKLNLSVIILVCLVAGLSLSTSCTKADAGFSDTASQVNTTTPGTAGTDTPAFVLPAEMQGEEEVALVATVEFGKDQKTELGDYTLSVHGSNLDVYTADGKKAGAFKFDGSKLVPASTQPMNNQVKATYSGPPGDNYTAFRVYPASHKTGDGMLPYFEIDHNGGQVNLTPGDKVKMNKHDKSRGKKTKRSGIDPSCGTGSSGGG